ncbi:MAG: hypothetical protein O3C34_15010 [Proteobacteria bacterium]|nr:hypothetical protein [Pseudomonadota bacterium]
MELDQTFSDDPVEIVKFLVKENGLDGARRIAVEGTTVANLEGNFYRLSIWREVKHVLRDWTDIPEEKSEETPAKISEETV